MPNNENITAKLFKNALKGKDSGSDQLQSVTKYLRLTLVFA